MVNSYCILHYVSNSTVNSNEEMNGNFSHTIISQPIKRFFLPSTQERFDLCLHLQQQQMLKSKPVRNKTR